MLWYGSVASIPSGWVLCDGNNSTPDLRNRFVIGAGTGGNYSPDDTGGSADATLVSHSHTINNHTHSFSGSNTHNHSYNEPNFTTHAFTGGAGSQRSQGTSGASTGNASITISGTTGNPSDRGTNSQGSSATNKNLPPYYALCYIMKT